jgi:uncharacterized protein (DUF3084 family)
MNRNDFRNPLIQSGILLLIVFISISIVANSPADGFIGSIFALVSGLLKGLLFVIALSIGLVFSIAVLIGIFILAVSIHSVDKARTLFEQLKTALSALYYKVRYPDNSFEYRAEEPFPAEQSASSAPRAAASEAVVVQKQADPKLEEKTNTLEDQLNHLQASLKSAEEQLLSLQSRSHEDQLSATDLRDRINDLEMTSTEFADTIKTQSAEIAAAAAEISELHKKTSVPEVVSGILAYIDTQEERDTLTERAEEAVSRGMTYAQTDQFFKKTLPAKVHKALSEHPRLTKDFIRSIKKKFE